MFVSPFGKKLECHAHGGCLRFGSASQKDVDSKNV